MVEMECETMKKRTKGFNDSNITLARNFLAKQIVHFKGKYYVGNSKHLTLCIPMVFLRELRVSSVKIAKVTKVLLRNFSRRFYEVVRNHNLMSFTPRSAP